MKFFRNFVPSNQLTYKMKKILIFLFPCLFLGSCGVRPPAPYTESFFIDFRPLTEAGYYITESPSVSFPYDAKGSIFVSSKGGWLRKEKVKDDSKADYYVNSSSYYYYEAPNLSQAYEELKKTLAELDANGVINIHITSQRKYNDLVKAFYDDIIITGMAIKK